MIGYLIIIVDTIVWILQKVKEMFGFKKKVVLLSDGCASQNWNKEVFNQMPQIAQEYRQNEVLESFRAMKSVSGHSKG